MKCSECGNKDLLTFQVALRVWYPVREVLRSEELSILRHISIDEEANIDVICEKCEHVWTTSLPNFLAVAKPEPLRFFTTVLVGDGKPDANGNAWDLANMEIPDEVDVSYNFSRMPGDRLGKAKLEVAQDHLMAGIRIDNTAHEAVRKLMDGGHKLYPAVGARITSNAEATFTEVALALSNADPRVPPLEVKNGDTGEAPGGDDWP